MAGFTTIPLPAHFPIEFENPDECLPGENRSKRLRPRSALHALLTRLRMHLDNSGGVSRKPSRMPLHIELLNADESGRSDLLVERAQFLNGMSLDHSLRFAVDWLYGALVIRVPNVPGYRGVAHITIHYYGPSTGLESKCCLFTLANQFLANST